MLPCSSPYSLLLRASASVFPGLQQEQQVYQLPIPLAWLRLQEAFSDVLSTEEWWVLATSIPALGLLDPARAPLSKPQHECMHE